jgi:hypothetical protein
MNISTQKISLHQKLSSLENDIEAWNAIASENENEYAAIFARHQSQILRLHALFKGLIGQLKAEIDGLGADPSTVKLINNKILQGHSLWSYFRAKLMLRYDAHLRLYLKAADELAWACFKPLMNERNKANPSGNNFKVPPLIYLGRDISPFVFPRDWTIASQIPDVNDKLFAELVKKSPLSVVSLPFYQTSHLPETLVLAHEMGHVVEMDLALSDTLDQALEQVSLDIIPQDRKATWKRCRIEAFADVFGATVCGIAFCQALADFLSQETAPIATEQIGISARYAYPTRTLRVLMVIEAQRRENGVLPEQAGQIETAWRGAHGESHAFMEYEKDLPTIVQCFVDTPFAELGHKTIRHIAALGETGDKHAAICAKDLLKYGIIPDENDPRALIGAAVLAFNQNPLLYQKNNVGAIILDRISASADDAARSSDNIDQPSKDRDQKMGKELALFLG